MRRKQKKRSDFLTLPQLRTEHVETQTADVLRCKRPFYRDGLQICHVGKALVLTV